METQKIKALNFEGILKTGPLQFNEDWPGVFFSQGFVKEKISPMCSKFNGNIKEQSNDNTELGFDLESLIVMNIFRDLEKCLDEVGFKTSADVNLKELQFVGTEISDEDDDNYIRVESGVVSINGQVGYFFRGDNALYYGMILGSNENFKKISLSQELSSIFNSCSAISHIK